MLIKRERYLEHIRKFYDSNLIKVLTGIRRCGKSILLKQIKEEIMTKNNISDDHIISIDFEDAKFSYLSNFLEINDYILSLIKDDFKCYIFLDEIQHIKQFERLLASLKATQNVSLFVTGSNSKLLSGRLATLLVGRCKEFKIRPFCYEEALMFQKANNMPLKKDSFDDYLRYGGMPQRFDYDSEEDIKDYLRDIYEGITNKDICSHYRKINKESFTKIAN